VHHRKLINNKTANFYGGRQSKIPEAAKWSYCLICHRFAYYLNRVSHINIIIINIKTGGVSPVSKHQNMIQIRECR
jgi:hypothetical protein